MIETFVRAVLEEELTRHLGAGHYERSQERRGHRNGTKPRTMKSPFGELHFEVPQVREGGFNTQVFERFQRSDKALVSSMQEMVVKGVSTRGVSDILEKMGGFEVSAATVSRAMGELDEQIAKFFSRPLTEPYRYLVIDARYEKVRGASGRVKSQAVLIVAGIKEDGRRELLSLATGDSESLDTWGGVFLDLKKRGLAGVEMIVSDAHSGIRAAIQKHFQGTTWQRCRVHFMRELLAKVSYKDYKALSKDLRAIYASDERGQCLAVALEIAGKWQARAAKMSTALLAGIEDTLTAWSLPRTARRKLNSTNMMERLMKTIKQRTRQIGSFPNEAACIRLIGAVLLEKQDAWDTEPHRYIVIEQN